MVDLLSGIHLVQAAVLKQPGLQLAEARQIRAGLFTEHLTPVLAMIDLKAP
jgi:hypothetical protein